MTVKDLIEELKQYTDFYEVRFIDIGDEPDDTASLPITELKLRSYKTGTKYVEIS